MKFTTQIEDRLGNFDYLLSFIAASTALISAGYAVRNEIAGWTLVVVAAIGHLYARSAGQSKWVQERPTLDGLLFASAAIGCILFTPFINRLLPNSGFPETLLHTAALAFVIAIGSFFAWRDPSLLFLAVPAIALYGLVGAFDTFALAPGLFFLFLVCTGLLFSRANLRGMLKIARQAGEGDYQRLRRYAWKSIAGPEWALTSAVGVIALSALGAPLIRQTVQEATAPLRVNLRNAALQASQNQSRPDGLPQQNAASVRVGQGPFGRPSERPVLAAFMSEPRYLRGGAYYLFDRNRWQSMQLDWFRLLPADQRGLFLLGGRNTEVAELRSSRDFPFSLHSTSETLPGLFVPGLASTIRLETASGVAIRVDGIPYLREGGSPGTTMSGTSSVPSDDLTFESAAVPDYFDPDLFDVELTPRTRQLAATALQDATTDYDRVVALQRLVTERIRYNLQAPAVPEDRNLVDHMLFEQREGYCDVFATSLALLARDQGLPARVAVGYLVSEDERQSDGSFLVREADYHMWTEVYFEGAGWVSFDATEGADEVPGMGRGTPWREILPWYQQPWVSQAANIAIGIAVVIGLAVVLWDTVKKLLVRRVPKLAATLINARGETEVAIARALKQIESASGEPRRFEETVLDYAQRLSSSRPELQPDLDRLASAFTARLYALPQGDHQEWIRAMQREVKDLNSKLKATRRKA